MWTLPSILSSIIQLQKLVILHYASRLYVLYEIEGLKLKNYVVFEDTDGMLLIVNFND